MEEAHNRAAGRRLATNQVLYNLSSGMKVGPAALVPRARRVLAYSPLGSNSARLRTHPVLKKLAAQRSASPS